MWYYRVISALVFLVGVATPVIYNGVCSRCNFDFNRPCLTTHTPHLSQPYYQRQDGTLNELCGADTPSAPYLTASETICFASDHEYRFNGIPLRVNCTLNKFDNRSVVDHTSGCGRIEWNDWARRMIDSDTRFLFKRVGHVCSNSPVQSDVIQTVNTGYLTSMVDYNVYYIFKLDVNAPFPVIRSLGPVDANMTMWPGVFYTFHHTQPIWGKQHDILEYPPDDSVSDWLDRHVPLYAGENVTMPNLTRHEVWCPSYKNCTHPPCPGSGLPNCASSACNARGAVCTKSGNCLFPPTRFDRNPTSNYTLLPPNPMGVYYTVHNATSCSQVEDICSMRGVCMVKPGGVGLMCLCHPGWAGGNGPYRRYNEDGMVYIAPPLSADANRHMYAQELFCDGTRSHYEINGSDPRLPYSVDHDYIDPYNGTVPMKTHDWWEDYYMYHQCELYVGPSAVRGRHRTDYRTTVSFLKPVHPYTCMPGFVGANCTNCSHLACDPQGTETCASKGYPTHGESFVAGVHDSENYLRLGIGTPYCKCNSGYSGERCDKKDCPVAPGSLYGLPNTCNRLYSNSMCLPVDESTGYLALQGVNPLNRLYPYNSSYTSVCVCANGWGGPYGDCQSRVCAVAYHQNATGPTVCGGHGVCVKDQTRLTYTSGACSSAYEEARQACSIPYKCQCTGANSRLSNETSPYGTPSSPYTPWPIHEGVCIPNACPKGSNGLECSGVTVHDPLASDYGLTVCSRGNRTLTPTCECHLGHAWDLQSLRTASGNYSDTNGACDGSYAAACDYMGLTCSGRGVCAPPGCEQGIDTCIQGSNPNARPVCHCDQGITLWSPLCVYSLNAHSG